MIKSRIFKFASVILEDRRSAEDSAGERAKEKQKQNAHIERARIRCRELRELRYCSACHVAFERIQSFCDQCSGATGPLPSTYALDYARAEFPDLVQSREDFDRLVG